MNRIALLDGPTTRERAGQLGAVLADCIAGGASCLFTDRLTEAEATACYQVLADRIDQEASVLLAAYVGDCLRGTVELVLDTPPNQRHRAELSKLLVHRAARWRGLGRSLVLAAEVEARDRGRTLLSLDTTVGSLAERLFAGMAYQRVGVIPGYALLPNGLSSDAVLFWKAL